MASERPMWTGTLFALSAAVLFGLTIPVIQRAGAGVGPMSTAALLYAGAALGTLRFGSKRPAQPGLRLTHVPRLLLVALLGSSLAPSLFAWGLQRTSGTSAALLLNFEAVATLALAALVYRERVGWRVAVAASLMLAAGALLVIPGGREPARASWGAVAVVGAVLAWSLDNTLTRPLADLDARAVVRGKALLGAFATLVAAAITRETAPGIAAVSTLLLAGALGYGLSLRLYLGAQRRIGAGRTGSVYAVAPFVGAVAAFAAGERSVDWRSVVAAGLFGVSVLLHLMERHAHQHEHEPIEHEHLHRHDDGHHDHAHEEAPIGEHSHPHRHEFTRHTHAHGEDLHHRHSHGEPARDSVQSKKPSGRAG